jgi:putative hydrolase of the HAD superfamily
MASSAPLQAVILDRDGVLTYFDLKAAAQFFGPRIPLPLTEIFARWEALGRQHGFPRSGAEEQAFFQRLWHGLADEFGLDAATRAELLEFDYTVYVKPFPEVRAALESIKGRGLRLGVLSNFSLASLDDSLAAAGLADLVDAACASTVIGYAKPEPAAYTLTAQALGVPPQACLFLDDEAICVDGARAVGMVAVQVDRRRAADDPTMSVLADLRGLPALLDDLAA